MRIQLLTILSALLLTSSASTAQNCDHGVINHPLVQCIEYGGNGMFSLFPYSYEIPADGSHIFEFIPVPGQASGGGYPGWNGADPDPFIMGLGAQWGLPFIFNSELNGFTTGQMSGDPMLGKWMMHHYIVSDSDYPSSSLCATNPSVTMLEFKDFSETCTQNQSTALWISPQTMYSGPNCDGSVEVVINSGTPPFSYSFSTGDTAVSSLSGLCPGAYSVTVQDGTGAVALSEFVIPTEEYVYWDSLISNLIDPDTLFINAVEECDLDYTAPLDSFSIDEALVVFGDTVLAEWTVWQGGEPFTVLGQYPPNYTGSEPVFALSLYCMNGRSNIGAFQLYATADQIIQNVEETVEPQVMVYPNPSNSRFTVFRSSNENATFTLTDNSGRMIRSGNISGAKAEIELEADPNGIYVLKIQSESHVQTVRLIKN